MIKDKIRTIPDYPKKGILYRDITPLIKDPIGLKLVVDEFARHYQENNLQFDLVVGIEARGFIFGGALAYNLGKGFIPIRKSGKLPAAVIRETYDLEYGQDHIEMHVDAILANQRVILVDDLLATGGTAMAATSLIEKSGGKIVDCAFIINLLECGGEQRLKEKGYNVFYLTEFKD